MILLASQLLGQWLIDSSQTRPVGELVDFILEPNKLQIKYLQILVPGERLEYFAREDHIQWNKNLLLIKSASFIGEIDDFVRDQELIKDGCNPIAYRLLDEQERFLGKVSDFSFSTTDGLIEKLMIKPVWWQSFWQSDRIISRTNIREVKTDKHTIIIHDSQAKVSTRAAKPIPA